MSGASGILAAAMGTQAISQFGSATSQAGALESQGRYEKSQFDTNAEFAELEASDAIRRGKREEKEFRRRTAQTIGQQRAGLAAQGIDVNSGTALGLQEDTAEFGELDALTIRNNAWREAYGYRTQAADYRTRGAFAEMSGRRAARQTLIGGGMSALSSGLMAGYHGFKDRVPPSSPGYKSPTERDWERFPGRGGYLPK